MPILDIKTIAKHTKLYVWHINEDSLPVDDLPSSVKTRLLNLCNARKNEIAAVYSILKEAIGEQGLVIEHDACGKPFLTINGKPTEYRISISHTNGYASMMLSETSTVAVDIEYRSNRIARIAGRFLRADELHEIKMAAPTSPNESSEKHDYETITRLLLYWCAKETAYKYYSDERLTFQNILVSDIGSMENEGCFTCKNLINNETLKIHFIQNENFILTYCHEKL